jgi:hypothetical protein
LYTMQHYESNSVHLNSSKGLSNGTKSMAIGTVDWEM